MVEGTTDSGPPCPDCWRTGSRETPRVLLPLLRAQLAWCRCKKVSSLSTLTCLGKIFVIKTCCTCGQQSRKVRRRERRTPRIILPA